MSWFEYKDEAARLLFEKDALHIYAAVFIQVAVAAIQRRSLGHALPWLVVLAFEIVNEALDILLSNEPVIKPWQVVGGVHDLVNTMILPTALLWLCRHRPDLFAWSVRRHPD